LLQGLAIDGRKVNELTISGWVKLDGVVPGSTREIAPGIGLTLYDDQRKELGTLILGPWNGTSDWHEETKTFRIPPAAREGIFRIGLFGATGKAAFDKLSIKKVEK
jgi:protein-L-isoaspartate(D-aspartate) O-methyltransferase